jgi:hypothetical protein
MPNQRFGGDRLCSNFPNCIKSPMLYEPLLWREGLLRFSLLVCFSFCPVKGLSLLGSLYIDRFAVLVFFQFWMSVFKLFFRL